ncbi:MAG: hypothetical protein WCV68_01770 [Candidatus Paceibacterota bacterium]|jgi:hypothetical protein
MAKSKIRKVEKDLVASKGKKTRGKKVSNVPKMTGDDDGLFKFVDSSGVQNPLILLDFIKWSAVPKETRELKTLGDFETFCGLSRKTLLRWTSLPGFWDEVALYRNQVMRSFSTEMGFILVKSARQKLDHKPVEIFFRLFEGLKSETEIPQRSQLTEEQKEKLRGALKLTGLASIVKDNLDDE